MSWTAQTKDTIEFVRDAAKQVITLSTTLLAATITLFGHIVRDRVVTSNDLLRLRLSWIFLGASVLFGVICLLVVVRVSSPKDSKGNDRSEPTVYDQGIRIWSGLQLLGFVVGLALFAYFGVELVDNPLRPASGP
jgi:hypothetical protein